MPQRIFWSFLFIAFIKLAYSQCPGTSFTVSTDFCINENLDLQNTSIDATSYEWDFCSQDLGSTSGTSAQSLLSVSGINEGYGIDLVETDGQEYLFITSSKSGQELKRIDFGAEIGTDASVVSLGNLAVRPSGIKLIEEGGIWYGLLQTFDGLLYRLTFDSGITDESITVEEITGLTQLGNARGGLDIVQDGSTTYAVLVGSGQLQVVRFPSGISSAYDGELVTNIPSSGNSGEISLYNECGTWYALYAAISGGAHHMTFPSGLFAAPTITQIVASPNFGAASIIYSQGNYYGFLTNSTTPALVRMDFGTSLSNTSPTVEDMGDLGQVGLSTGLEMYHRSRSYAGIGMNIGGQVFKVDFDEPCTLFSAAEEPVDISYSSAGTYDVTLYGIDDDGFESSATSQITVSSSSAPDIDFSIDDDRCIAVENTFTSINLSGDITSYLWDFGDGNTSTSANPTYQYLTAGSYDVTLTVSNADGCTNSISQSITVYDDAPTPSFSSSGTLCSGSTINFTNNTDETGFNSDDLSYLWDFNGEATSSDKDAFFVFSTSGSKTITLTISIPGCEQSVDQVIVLESGPDASFSYTNNCFGEAIQFSDETVGEVTTYFWDFGDGNTSNSSSPSHTYLAAGTYNVELTTTNSSGCESTFSREITVNDQPLTSFTTSELTENVPVSFTGQDLTLIDDDITDWSWDFDGLGVSNDQSPTFVFSSPGDYQIDLDVITSQGCSFSLSEIITINEATCAFVDMSFQAEVCIGEPLEITNNSVNAESYEWDFCGQDLGDVVGTTAEQLLTIGGVSEGYGIDLVEANGEEYLFVTSSGGSQELRRIDFGSEIGVSSNVVSLGSPVANASGFKMIEEGGTWYGLLQTFDGALYRLTFDSGITDESVTVEQIVGITEFSNARGGLEIIQDGSITYVILAGDGQLQVLRFSSGISSSFDGELITDITGASSSGEISFFNECGTWYGLYAAISGGAHHLSFPSGLFAAPTVTQIVASPNFGAASLIYSQGNYYGLLTNSTTPALVRMDFGTSLSNTSPAVEDMGDLGEVGLSTGLEMFHRSRTYSGIGMNINGEVFKINFDEQCSLFSAEEVPSGISYSSAGTYDVTLYGIGDDGTESSITSQVIVNSSSAPDINFSIDENRCVDVENSFTPINVSGDIASYNWDFGDGTSSNLSNPTHQFSSGGTYLVSLEVSSADGCTNSTSQSITIYDDAPTPSFSSSGTLCSASEINFSNTTDESGFDSDDLSYSWDFNGEGTATTKDASFIFSTSGSKTVTLSVSVPGCEQSVDQVIVLEAGPEASFSYTNNCFGEAIQFLDETTGEVTTYLWDFGDGDTSSDSSPSHTYLAAGTYTVDLTTTNSFGCESTFSQDITVNDQPLASFTTSELTENIIVAFTGQDLTLSDDNIISWAWNFNDLGSSNDQNTNFTFSSPGDYQIDLDVTTSQGCSYSFSEIITVEDAKCATIEMLFQSELCLGERLDITNNSVNAESYEWDFCGQDLTDASGTNAELLVSIGGVSEGYGIDQVQANGEEYMFVTSSQGGQELRRIDFGSEIGSSPNIVSLGSLVSNPSGFKMIEEGGIWYGFLQTGDGELYRLIFDSGITDESITVEQITGITQLGNARGGLEILQEGSETYIVLSGDGQLQVLRFSSGVSSSFDGELITDISGATSSGEVSFVNECGIWYGLYAAISGGAYHLSFPDGLFSTPTVTQIVASPNFGASSLVFSQGNYFGFLTNTTIAGVVRMDFGASLSNTSPDVVEMGDLGQVGLSTGLEMYHRSRSYSGVGMNINGEVYKLNFDEPCSLFSTDAEPIGVSYDSPGTYNVALYGIGENGVESSMSAQVIVNSTNAPDISFNLGESVCLSTDIEFIPSIPELDSYSWDFNGDGIEDSNQENPTFDYSSMGAGAYTIRLDVNDGSCDNFVEEEITIYDPPPAPSYNVTSTLFCLNTDINFTNTTSDGTYEGPLTYLWEFIDDESGAVVGNSTNKDAAFAFVTAGQKTIRLTSSIPGCEEITEQTITINPGPTADFFAPTVCQNEAMQFTNTSTSGVSYLWDFGDGVTSTNENPSHVYTEAGNYNVQLTTTDALGCDASQVIEVAVSALPSVNFEFTAACNSAEGVQFTDQTTIENADVIAWSWMVDGSEVSTVQNPTLSFPEGGTRNVSLVVTGSNGCTATYNEDIEILSAPVPDFTVAVGCQGETTLLNDASVSSGNPVVSWLWDVNGESYTTNDVEHIFADPGTYEVTLEVTAQNFCSESITKTVEILQLPEVNFSIQGGCDNEVILTEDLSTEFVDPINVRRWMLDGANVGSGSQLFLQNLAAGTYDIVLEVETETGCVTSSTQPLIINAAPETDFTFDRNYGIPGDQIGFTNTSNGGTSFQWLLDGEEFSTSAISQNFIFEEPGTYLVSLVSQNDLGCSDTTNQEVLIAVPQVDLRIGSFDLIQEGNIGKIFFEIENQSNLPVERIEATIELENQFSVTEEVNQLIGIRETVLVGLDVGIPLVASQTTYFCVNLASQYNGYDDVEPLNNEKCLTVEPQITVEDPYPNPVTDQFRVRVVVPDEQSVNVTLINSAGKIETEQSFAADVGLNSYFIDMSTLNPGIYFVNIEVGNQTFRRKVIKF